MWVCNRCLSQNILNRQLNKKGCTRDEWSLGGTVKQSWFMRGGPSQKVDCGWSQRINNHHAHVQEMGYTCCIPCVKTLIINDNIISNHSSGHQSPLWRLKQRLRFIWKTHVSREKRAEAQTASRLKCRVTFAAQSDDLGHLPFATVTRVSFIKSTFNGYGYVEHLMHLCVDKLCWDADFHWDFASVHSTETSNNSLADHG